MTLVVWREWYNEQAVEQLTAMGTLPHNETELPIDDLMDGCDVAAEVAKLENHFDCTAFERGGKIVILEPEYVAGTFEINVEYEPFFSACEADE